ncbi:MAG: hypothetical protein JOY78_09415 [Pseudonocardia sp.]|nr:hypothetical protein [Pseudonocardia sp.]
MPPSSVHFNGSVNLPDAETVMREISTRIPTGVHRMTDGETGERGYWILFQIQKFLQMPELESVTVGQAYETASDAPAMPQLRLAEGASAETIVWPNLGYADAYLGSFTVFDRLQRDGTIPPDVRFQVQYPTPLASTAGTFAAQDMAAIAASYEAALFADLARLLERLPHDRCAVQWDVAVEFGLLEGAMGPRSAVPLEQITPALVRCIDQVPVDVPVGLHLCYGDYGHQHFAQPRSLQMQVDLVNAVVTAAQRPVAWASFTVPQAREDAGYFAPLRELVSGPETELAFALVPYHPDDQADGTTATQAGHIDAALAESTTGARKWGVCTECGMGRVAVEDVPRLLNIHHEIISRWGERGRGPAYEGVRAQHRERELPPAHRPQRCSANGVRRLSRRPLSASRSAR